MLLIARLVRVEGFRSFVYETNNISWIYDFWDDFFGKGMASPRWGPADFRPEQNRLPIAHASWCFSVGSFAFDEHVIALVRSGEAPGIHLFPFVDERYMAAIAEEAPGAVNDDESIPYDFASELETIAFNQEHVPRGRLFSVRIDGSYPTGLWASTDDDGRFPPLVERFRSGELQGIDVVTAWSEETGPVPHNPYSSPGSGPSK